MKTRRRTAIPRFGFALLTVVLLAGQPGAAGAAQALPPQVLITDVAHTLDGRSLIVTGFVRNQGPRPLPRVVIDASGFGPSGELATAGSDGIPWRLQSGESERFSIAMPIGRRLVREYVVQVAQTTPPFTPYSSFRRGVDLALYRPLLLSMIQIRVQVFDGLLIVKAETEDLPITHVLAQVTVLVESVVTDQFEPVTLHLDITANTSTSVFFGTRRTLLLASRVVDFRLKSNWSE